MPNNTTTTTTTVRILNSIFLLVVVSLSNIGHIVLEVFIDLSFETK